MEGEATLTRSVPFSMEHIKKEEEEEEEKEEVARGVGCGGHGYHVTLNFYEKY